MEQRRVTQLDVAREAGVHRSTVSLAFRNDPSIPPGTRERVMRVSKKLGYSIDPMLSALAAYRTRIRPAKYHGTFAWLANSEPGFKWRSHLYFADYFAGAVERARDHGYGVEVFEMDLEKMPPSRVSSILSARNIRGVLVCPQPRPEVDLGFAWQNFSAVTFGYSLKNPRLHTVTAAHYQASLQTMRSLIEMGYERIGLVLNHDHDRRTEYNYMAGFRVAEQLIPLNQRVPPLMSEYDDKDAMAQWLQKNRPDVIVSCNYRIANFLKTLPAKFAQSIDLACPALPNGDLGLAGIIESSKEIGRVAVDMLVGMVQRGEQAPAQTPYRVHVEGHWTFGETLRRAKQPARRK